MFLNILVGLIVVGIFGVSAFFIIRRARRKALYRLLSQNLYLIKIPREDKEQKDFKEEINRFEQLLSNLTSIKQPFIFEVAVPHIGEEIHFYISVPKNSSSTALKQIQGLWNGASIEEVASDYNIFNAEGSTSVAFLKLKGNFALPVRTYRDLESDSFASIVGGFSKVNEIGEGAAMQVIVSPASSDSAKTVRNYIRSLRKGSSLDDIFGKGFSMSFAEVLSPRAAEQRKEEMVRRVIDEEAIKALESKISKPLFNVNIRFLASASSPFQADTVLHGITAGFSQFSSPGRNEFKLVKPRISKKMIYNFSFRSFDADQTMILNSEEIASVFHLPTSRTETPKIKWLKSKEAPPPDGLPASGTLIGRSNFRGEVKPVYITDEDRRRHVYLIGQTGTGKSTLLSNMIVEDINRGKGVAMIDPHGDLVDSVIGRIPKNRVDDLIYFDPSDLDHPLGLNMLEYNFNRPEEKTFIVNEMQSIFNRLFSQETMGPMFEQYMRNALLLLMEDMQSDPATLIEVPRVFTDSEFRREKLLKTHNPVVIDFWEKEAVKAGGEASLSHMTPYITSKFNNFIANDYMRPIIGQQKSAFNFRQVLDEGKILLVNLAKGRIGDINAGLLGMIITGKILMAALSRADTPAFTGASTGAPDRSGRREFNLYIDEFQNFTTDSISTILSEARKYGLSLTIAHQFIAQLTEKIRDAVFGNVGSQIVFRVGVQDAEFLRNQFEPIFSRNDLIGIDNFNAFVKILVNGETTRPFNIMTLPFEHGSSELVHKMKEYSAAKYGANRQETEFSIYDRLRR